MPSRVFVLAAVLARLLQISAPIAARHLTPPRD
jgi:hypothetical protein